MSQAATSKRLQNLHGAKNLVCNVATRETNYNDLIKLKLELQYIIIIIIIIIILLLLLIILFISCQKAEGETVLLRHSGWLGE